MLSAMPVCVLKQPMLKSVRAGSCQSVRTTQVQSLHRGPAVSKHLRLSRNLSVRRPTQLRAEGEQVQSKLPGCGHDYACNFGQRGNCKPQRHSIKYNCTISPTQGLCSLESIITRLNIRGIILCRIISHLRIQSRPQMIQRTPGNSS